MKEKRSFGNKMLTVVFSIISVIYIIPIFEVLINSFKENSFVNTDAFALPTAESFVGWANYIKGIPGSTKIKQSIFSCKTKEELVKILEEYRKTL